MRERPGDSERSLRHILYYARVGDADAARAVGRPPTGRVGRRSYKKLLRRYSSVFSSYLYSLSTPLPGEARPRGGPIEKPNRIFKARIYCVGPPYPFTFHRAFELTKAPGKDKSQVQVSPTTRSRKSRVHATPTCDDGRDQRPACVCPVSGTRHNSHVFCAALVPFVPCWSRALPHPTPDRG